MRDLSRLVDSECKIVVCCLTRAFFFRQNLLPQSGLCDMKEMYFVENRNHVWRDLIFQ